MTDYDEDIRWYQENIRDPEWRDEMIGAVEVERAYANGHRPVQVQDDLPMSGGAAYALALVFAVIIVLAIIGVVYIALGFEVR